MKLIARIAPIGLLFSTACSDVEAPDGCHYHGDELHCDDNHGLATTMVLHFTPEGGGDTLSFSWSDPNNDANPVIDTIYLPDATDHNHHDALTYTLDIEILNELEDPIEDVTVDIEDQADQHQFFFTGSAVQSDATGNNPDAIIAQSYADTDANGLPVGLTSTIDTLAWGSGELTISLRHIPLENGESLKTAGMAETVATDGVSALPGASDIEVTFPIEVE